MRACRARVLFTDRWPASSRCTFQEHRLGSPSLIDIPLRSDAPYAKVRADDARPASIARPIEAGDFN